MASVEVDVDLDDFDFDELLDAIKYKLKWAQKRNKEDLIKEFTELLIEFKINDMPISQTGKPLSINDQKKHRLFNEYSEQFTLDSFEDFLTVQKIPFI